MRLWHQDLLDKLPRQQLLGQHRECCALRGNGWGRKHATVDYVFTYNPVRLITYHFLVMNVMDTRGYKNVDYKWFGGEYRGKNCIEKFSLDYDEKIDTNRIFPEHNDEYMAECLENLSKKGVNLQ